MVLLDGLLPQPKTPLVPREKSGMARRFDAGGVRGMFGHTCPLLEATRTIWIQHIVVMWSLPNDSRRTCPRWCSAPTASNRDRASVEEASGTARTTSCSCTMAHLAWVWQANANMAAMTTPMRQCRPASNTNPQNSGCFCKGGKE